MLNELYEYLFGRLDSRWCVIFKYITIFQFISLCVISIYIIKQSLKNKISISLAAILFSQPFLHYIMNRILYSMCMRS